jgi:hypothetical protein
MGETRGLRLTPSVAVKEKRLAALLAGRDEHDAQLVEDVEDAQLLGSLELAGFSFRWPEVKASRSGPSAAGPLTQLRAAQHTVAPAAPFSVAAVLAWHAAVVGQAGEFRRSEQTRAHGPAPAPVAFVRSRLEILEHWLNVDSGRELTGAQRGALALARLLEIRPFEQANGRVARLAASHLMVRAGARPPILVAGDAPRLEACVDAAFQLQTEPLTSLLEEASGRALDVMIQTLESSSSRV